MVRRKWLPDNVTAYKDRHGKTRYRFRKSGMPVYHFRFDPGTPEFLEELANAKNAKVEKQPRYAPFTYDALIVSFYASTKWQRMKPSSKKTYSGIIERFRAKNGSKDVRNVTAGSIEKKLGAMLETPAAANNLRKALARLHRHAIKLDWRKDNPVAATDPYPTGKGWHSWTETEIDLFDARWPFGTRERLAKELLLETTLRKSDAILVGKQHRRGSALHLHHSKNDSDTIIEIGPDLDRAMAEYDSGHMTYLTTQFGHPYSPTGFYNWFKRACVKAGIPHCSPHGLRKASSRRLVESGATSAQGRAVTGHKTDREFAHYAEAANRQELAATAVANLHKKFAKSERKK
jgi:integrase